jgi:DNA-binding beta-propeller fold protein YncE
LLACLAVFLSACASTTQETLEFEPPVYPAPPEKPRFIYELSMVNSSQVVVEDEKTKLRRMLTGEAITGKSFAKPFDVCACNGRVYVSDTVRRLVMVFDFPAGSYYEIGENEPGVLAKPLGVTTDDDCNLYVVDGTANRVVKYDQTGQFVSAYGGMNDFDRLSHAAVDAEGTRLFAVDTGGVSSRRHHVRVYDIASGKHLYDIGTRGDKEGQLNLPRDIILAPDGLLYVVDGGNFRIQVFQKDGKFVRTFGQVGRHFGQFSRPKGIAADKNGNIYVSDAAFGNFQIFTPEGQLLLYIGNRSNKNGPGKYLLPAGIDVDEDGRIYFVGQFFRKVDIYRPFDLKPEQGYLGARLTKKKNK